MANTHRTPGYMLRIDQDLSRKIKTLAKLEERAYRGQIEFILKKYIEAYEAEHGAIPLFDED